MSTLHGGFSAPRGAAAGGWKAIGAAALALLAGFGGFTLAGGTRPAAAQGAAPAPTSTDAAGRAALTRPAAPFRILGNVYFVGTADVASYLIVTPAGSILVDGGLEETAPLIRQSMAQLGFSVHDLKILVNSHAHSDHAGGLAQLKQWSGARFLASAGDAPILAAGGRGDFFLADRERFPPIKADEIVTDGQAVTLGGTTLVAHLTPGHTRGATTWTTQVADSGKTYDVVFFSGTTVLPGYRLVAPESYPGMAADYAHSFKVLAALPCDVFLAPHASMNDAHDKADRLRAGTAVNPFVDPKGYRDFIAASEAAYRRELAAQQAEAKKPTAHPAAAAAPGNRR